MIRTLTADDEEQPPSPSPPWMSWSTTTTSTATSLNSAAVTFTIGTAPEPTGPREPYRTTAYVDRPKAIES